MDHIQLYPGLRVGAVELIKEVEPRDSINGSKYYRQWEVICDCGRHAFRTVSCLTLAIKHGHESCCEGCLQELRRGLNVQYSEILDKKAQIRASFYTELFLRHGTLYTPHYGKLNTEPTIDLDTVQLDHPVRNISLSYHCYETDLEYSNPDYPQQNQWLVPIKNVGGWICYHCEKPFSKGSGCVRCLAHICDSCKSESVHICPRGWGSTWENETKDSGLLDRRIQLLKSKTLKLTTSKEVRDTRRKIREEYQKWLENTKLERIQKNEDERKARTEMLRAAAKAKHIQV
jgi:hypothetical protein